MADVGYLRSLLSGMSNATDRKILTQAFEHVLGNLRHGEPDHQTRAENFQAYYQQSTTASDTSEFSFAHGLPSAPSLAIPVIDLRQPGAQFVPLRVTRAADSRRVYLASSSTNAAFTLLIE